MSAYDKEIESLRNKLEKLESAKRLEEKQATALTQIESDLRSALQEADISIDLFLSSIYRDIKRVVVRAEKEREKSLAEKDSIPKKPRKYRKKKSKAKVKVKPSIKIKAGTYGNIPSAPDKVFIVKEKGPRLKIIKAYANEVGIDEFMRQCRID